MGGEFRLSLVMVGGHYLYYIKVIEHTKKDKRIPIAESKNNSGHGRNDHSDGSRICRICTTKKKGRKGAVINLLSRYTRFVTHCVSNENFRTLKQIISK